MLLKSLRLIVVLVGSLVFTILTQRCSSAKEQEKEVDIHDSYEGATVFKVHPKDSTEIDFLHNLMMSRPELDFWVEPRRTGGTVKFLAPNEAIDGVKLRLSSAGISYEESDLDLQDEQRQKPISLRLRSSISGEIDLDTFNNLHDINAYLRGLETNCPTGLHCHLYSIGNSFEGHKLLVLKISKGNRSPYRKGFWIDATIHAREWLTTATALKILDHLIHQKDANARRLINSYDWYIAPMLNPDGYDYSFKKRFWRKNRRTFTNSSCIGVDLNRNFAYRWGHEGVNQNPCCETNCGPNSGSEPEVQSIQEEAIRLGPSLLGFISLHAFGEMWMFPYGNTVNYEGKVCERSEDYRDLMDVANAAADAVGATFATHWRRGTTCEVVYANSGSSLDYVKFVAGVKYTFALEIRGDGFNVDETEIQPSFLEIWNGIVAMCDAISAKSSNSSQRINGGGGTLFASLLFRWLGRLTEFHLDF